MPGSEKVIKELEGLRDICNAKSNMGIGKGKIAWAGYANAADDALTLLKEAEKETKTAYERGYRNGRSDEAGLRDGTIVQTFNPD